MAKIVSLRTGKVLNAHNYKENEKLLKTNGIYLGSIPLDRADELRKVQDSLVCEKAQIEELIEEFDQHYAGYLEDITKLLLFLGYNPIDFNCDTKEIYINEDGHIWSTDKEGG